MGDCIVTKIYLDTNIIVYALEDSKNPFGKDISSSSSDLFLAVISCKYHVIISSWTLTELSTLKKLEQVQMLLTMLKSKTIKIAHNQEDINNAKKVNPAHFQDELHGTLALRSGADYLVTRNINDFSNFKDRINLVKPERLL